MQQWRICNLTFMSEFYILGLLIVILTIGIILRLNRAKIIGKRGERSVNFRLHFLPDEYHIINDVYIYVNDKSVQIDHIVVSKFGVFVIETKNYSGKIYGNESQREWTQVFQYGKVKNKFYNPVKQNATHIYMLKKALAVSVPIYSVVVFIKADIDEVTADNVFDIEGMQDFIEETPSANISGAQIDEIYHALKEIKENCEISTAEHIQNIEQMKEDIENGICPRCGGALVERTGKNGKFTGCSNYPKCKFTKK